MSAGATRMDSPSPCRISRRRGEAEPSTSGVSALIIAAGLLAREPCKVRTVLSTSRRCVLGKPGFCALFSALTMLLTVAARADGCTSEASLAPCFDANSLWLPAGRAAFLSLPDTRVSAPRHMNFGFATELLRAPVTAHVASPDSSGRDVQIVDYA